MQLETLWILTNLACTDDSDNTMRILANSLGNPAALAEMSTEDLRNDLSYNQS